ncbi:PDZ domain-containing protein [Streptomyces sp. NPDC093586]|uniref:PDZ domain-containing protein n=1 Tax=Streptomyces sp. NPDC093586 TaxID=3366042 RepID=UPI00381FA6F3
MEQTALRPKPMPGQETGTGITSCPTRCPHAARGRRRRITTLLCGLLAATALLLAGIGLGTVGATVIGMSRLADPHHQPGAPGTGTPPGDRTAPAHPAATSGPAPVRAGATLGVEAVDHGKRGALVVGVHVPGPGYTAGLVRGDVLLAFGTTRVDSAADLARAVARARPGTEVGLTVRHGNGDHQRLTVVPGVVT